MADLTRDAVRSLIMKILVDNFKQQHTTRVMAIAHTAFGAGYFDEIVKAHSDGNRLFLVAIADDAVCGFVLARLLAADGSSELLKGDAACLPRHMKLADKEGKLGVIQSIAVAPSMQGRGVGRALLTAAEDSLRALDGEGILVPAWKHGQQINISGVLRGAGYQVCGEIAQYWRADCDARQFQCPVRETEYVCSMVVYFKSNLEIASMK